MVPDYQCPTCKAVTGYYEADSRCCRCDEIFDGSIGNCTKCGCGHYECLCECGEVLAEIDECLSGDPFIFAHFQQPVTTS